MNPVVILTVYTFVFSVVFKARWGVGDENKFQFALILFVGLIVYNMFAECVNRAPSLVANNLNYVKKVVFPLEILPLVMLGAALFHSTVSFGILLPFLAVLNFSLHWTVVFIPVVLLPMILMTLGACWFLASLGVFLRDVTQTVNILTTVLMFLSPIFYPIAALPEKYRIFISMNPLTIVIEQMRAVVIRGDLPSWKWLFILTVLSALMAWLGLVWFQKTRKGFADVL